MIFNLKSKSHKFATTVFLAVVVLFLPYCSKPEPEKIEAVDNRAVFPRMHAMEVSTVISDSGITRYRINTPQWDVYDKASQPYWEFPYGIHFERFNENLKVDANITANYAKFLEHEQMWELRGNVEATNIRGELFETELMYWDQRKERIYSDSLITVTQENHIISGVGFDSNQQLTEYEVKNIQAIIPVKD